MPELPEVETIMRGMRPFMEGRTITAVEQRRPDLRTPFPPHLKARLETRSITHITRRAKYIMIALDSGETLIIHLGMSGRIRLLTATDQYAVQKHDHFILGFDNGTRLVFTDPRRFGQVMLMPEAETATHPAFAPLGPEPLGNEFSAPILAAALKTRKGPIKTVLLDQHIVAGLGNIYVCEALFQSGIAPQRPAHSLTKSEIEHLTGAIKDVLNRAIAAGGSSLKDYRHTDGALGYFQHHFAVYGKAGEACPACQCDVSKTGGIRQIKQGGRSTFYCPHKQK